MKWDLYNAKLLSDKTDLSLTTSKSWPSDLYEEANQI